MVCCEIKDWLGAGDSRSGDDAVHSVCRTQCMPYSVLTRDHGMER